jgi:hypothetical protein
MRKEHFLVAELYRYLADFVDASRPIYLSLDGVAAEKGVREGLFTDPDVPDMYFTLIDGRQIALEAKMTYGKRFSVGRDQFRAWFENGGAGAHKPFGWVLASEDLTDFFFWSHEEIVAQRLTAPKPSEDRYVQIALPGTASMFPTIRHLALHILRTAA